MFGFPVYNTKKRQGLEGDKKQRLRAMVEVFG